MDLTNHSAIMVSLDVDGFLFDKLQSIAAAGLSVVEINSTDKNVLKSALNNFPSLRIGAGNVINTQQLEQCYEVGIAFVTSPGLSKSIAHTSNVYSINYLPGISTLTEALEAMELGCQHVRPLPQASLFVIY